MFIKAAEDTPQLAGGTSLTGCNGNEFKEINGLQLLQFRWGENKKVRYPYDAVDIEDQKKK